MPARAAAPAPLLLALALAGCLGAPPAPEAAAPPDPEPAPIEEFRPPPPRAAPPPANTDPTPPPPPPPPAEEAFDPGPLAVVAHVDTGINPYHRTFRDEGPLARVHPSRYLPGFPSDAPALNLSLDAPSYQDALIRDQALWEGVRPGQLYWVPGTRIAGAISFGPGGTRCPQPLVAVPSPPSPVPPLPPAVPVENTCRDWPILDEHGHGTMTASRMAARDHSLCPGCRIVTIEGLGPAGVQWAADQGWIDVQTNSWGDLLPTTPTGAQIQHPLLPDPAEPGVIRQAFAAAAERMMVFAASGNGIAFQGGVGEPNVAYATGAAGVLLVGAHDNGRVNLYPGRPHHLVADGYGGWMANVTSLDAFGPSPEACCTSASSPYAAGGAAAVLLSAREALGHRGTGWRDGVGARGAAIPGGPLDDSALGLAELHALVRGTAAPRPAQGADDGLVHWLATARGANDVPEPATDPGQNPYCPLCVATPQAWAEVPDGVPAWPLRGYGAVDAASVALAGLVLRGRAPMPDRAADDALFAADQQARAAVDLVP